MVVLKPIQALVLFTVLLRLSCANENSVIELNVAASGGNATSALQYGLMFEDINHSGDGGIYAELIQNRAFQANASKFALIEPWVGTNAYLTIDDTAIPLSTALAWSLKVSPTGTESGHSVTFTNPGWWGIDVKPQTYTGSFWVLGNYTGNFAATLQSNITGEVFAEVDIKSVSSNAYWTQHNFTLVPKSAAPNSNNSFSISYKPLDNDGILNFHLISLFPPTYKDRENGMRIDLMEHLAALNPSFHRIPGGNNLEGKSPPNRWIWNETIGPLKDRPGHAGTWSYYNTDGLGLAEYLNWCEDLSIEPILALWAGLYLDGTVIPQSELSVYIDDALNELEYVLGNSSTTYGALRASHGRSDPWQVKFVEIGNEDNLNSGLDSYAAYRFQMFYDAIKAAYPEITIVASTIAIPVPANADADYHQYTRPDQFVSQFSYFDQNHTGTSKVFIGEYATIQPNVMCTNFTTCGANFSTPQSSYPFWIGTVAEAVFLLGAERNTGSILGAAYAPLLQNLNSYEWAPDLISFTADPAQDVLSTSHQVIELLSGTRFTDTLPVKTNADFGPAYWVAGLNQAERFYGAKLAVYNTTNGQDVQVAIKFEGVQQGIMANLTVLTANDPYASVILGGSNPVVKTVSTVTASNDGMFTFELPELSVAVLRTENVGMVSTNSY